MDNPNEMKRSAGDLLSGATAEAACSNKKSCTTDNTDPSGISGFIAAAVVQYLGVRSLVHFGATSKSNKAVVDEEVGRRKEEIVGIEKELKVLMGSDHGKGGDDLLSSAPITRSNMEKAMKLSNYALQLIDDEIDFQRKLGTQEMRWMNDWDGDAEWTEHDVFLVERKKFLVEACKPFGSLVVLPECFYCPPEGDSSKPSDEYIKKAHQKAGWIWGAEDHMGSVYEWGMMDPNWDRLDYEQPFRKFTLSGAGFFTHECMEETAMDMAGRGAEDNRMKIEAFRIAARKLVFSRPGARDCLWYTLSKADEYLEEAIENSDSE